MKALDTMSVHEEVFSMNGDHVLSDGDHLLLLAQCWEDARRWNFNLSDASSDLIESAEVADKNEKLSHEPWELLKPDGQLQLGRLTSGPKVVLLIGCPPDFPNVLLALDNYLARGSEVHVLSTKTFEWRQDTIERFFGPQWSATDDQE